MFKGKSCLQRRLRKHTWRWYLPEAKLNKYLMKGGQWCKEGRNIDKDLVSLVEQSQQQYGTVETQTNLLRKPGGMGDMGTQSF